MFVFGTVRYKREKTIGDTFIAHETCVLRNRMGTPLQFCKLPSAGLQPARHILSIQALHSLKYSERDLNPHPEGLIPKTSVSTIPPSESIDGCVPLL